MLKKKKLEKSPKAYFKYQPTLASLLLLNILTIRGLKLNLLFAEPPWPNILLALRRAA